MKLLKLQNRYIALSSIALLIILSQSIYGQGVERRTHDLGEFRYQVAAHDRIEGESGGGGPTGNWPQDYFNYEQVTFSRPQIGIGYYYDQDSVLVANKSTGWPGDPSVIDYSFREVRRHYPPEMYVTVNGQKQRSSRPYNGEVDPNLKADQMIELRYKHRLGFDIINRSYSFVNQNHDDYVIIEYTIKATFDLNQDGIPDLPLDRIYNGVYFTIANAMASNEGSIMINNADLSLSPDEWSAYEVYKSNLVSSGRTDLTISYTWDGDDQNVTEFEPGGKIFDDTGDPRRGYGDGSEVALPSAEFVSSAYGGYTVLHADVSVNDKSDNLILPWSVLSDFSLQDYWQSAVPDYASIYAWASSGDKKNEVKGWPTNPGLTKTNMPMQSNGPYDMAYGDSIHIVYAIGINGISRDIAETKGLEWRDWYRDVPGNTGFDDAAKNALIATGKDSLFQTLDRALLAYTQDYDIPAPLSSPDLNVTSGPGKIILEWEDLSSEVDANTGVTDLDHYNIYRKLGYFLSDKWEELRENVPHIKWEKIAEVSSDQTKFIDTNVVRGEAYHYGVTAVDDGTQNTTGLFPKQMLESSKYANRTVVGAIPFAPGEDNSNRIRVIPNPYLIGAGDYNFTGDDDRILFANLPAYCKLRIYTVTGDLIKTIDHVSGDADDSWDMITESTQFVSSGIYVLQVTEARDVDNNTIPDAIEKFVIIR